MSHDKRQFRYLGAIRDSYLVNYEEYLKLYLFHIRELIKGHIISAIRIHITRSPNALDDIIELIKFP